MPGRGQAATYLLKGTCYRVNDGLADLQQWVVANGYKLSSSIRMLYLRGPIHGVAESERLTKSSIRLKTHKPEA